jgi:hypothetical protein
LHHDAAAQSFVVESSAVIIGISAGVFVPPLLQHAQQVRAGYRNEYTLARWLHHTCNLHLTCNSAASAPPPPAGAWSKV